MTGRKPPWDPQRDYYSHRIRSQINRFLTAHPETARVFALGMCERMCKVMLVQDLKTWALSLSLKLECPFLSQVLTEPDAKPDDTS